jgi:hypothetical protein
MTHHRKEPGELLNKAQSSDCRVEDWGKNVVIFLPNETAQPYIAHNADAFHETPNSLQRVHERYNTDVTQMIF